MSELSVFVDESGDVGSQSDYYVLALVFHDQAHSIAENVHGLAETLRVSGLPEGPIHTGPLIRREDEYRRVSVEIRHKLFAKLYGFVRRCHITFTTFDLKKREYSGEARIKERLNSELVTFLSAHRERFGAFDQLVVYYDNGQDMVRQVLTNAFTKVFANVDFRKIDSGDYRLQQAADMFCTFEMLRCKEADHVPMTNSEKIFFGSRRALRKDYLKTIERLRFK